MTRLLLLNAENVKVYNLDGEEIKKEPYHVEWDISAAEKGGYEHFMFKEIMEQPQRYTRHSSAENP